MNILVSRGAINPAKLTEDLQASYPDVSGVSYHDGVATVHYRGNPGAMGITAIQAIVTAHDKDDLSTDEMAHNALVSAEAAALDAIDGITLTPSGSAANQDLIRVVMWLQASENLRRSDQ